MSLESIRKHWIDQGYSFPMNDKVTPTTRDYYLGLLEEKNILDHLGESDRVLEIGCGDGQHSIKYLDKVKELQGIDISFGLVNIALDRLHTAKNKNYHLSASSVMDLNRNYEPLSFDKVISQRCLINLPSWDYQKKALLKIHKLLRKGGLLLMTEGFEGELKNLNVLREKLGLEPIKTVHYNHNFERETFEKFIKRHFRIVKVKDYGLYLLLSRTLNPLIVAPDRPRHDSPINDYIMQLSKMIDLEGLSDYSFNLFYVLSKL